MDKIIYRCVNLDCSLHEAFEYFTVNSKIEKWLTEKSEVVARRGGKYELFWMPEDRENDSTIGCRILAMSRNKFLCFEWKGPKRFKHFMNDVRPLTNVLVFFLPHPGRTEVHLIHSGWRHTGEWEEARRWFDEAWRMALKRLEIYVAPA